MSALYTPLAGVLWQPMTLGRWSSPHVAAYSGVDALVVRGPRKELDHAVRAGSAYRVGLRKVQAPLRRRWQTASAARLQRWRLLCTVDNPHEYTALFEWDDVEKARGFAASFEQGEALEWAGMIGPSKATVLEEVEAVGA